MNGWKRKRTLFGPAKFQNEHAEALRVCLEQLLPGLITLLGERKASAPKDELAELADMPVGHKEAPTDPRLARLLPDFEKAGDEEYEGDNALLRSLHEADIIDAKVTNLQIMAHSLAEADETVTITATETTAWLVGLTDIRLFLLSGPVTEEDHFTEVAEFLGYILEGLLAVLDEDHE